MGKACAVMDVLRPIWRHIPETASRVRGRIEAILDYAKVAGWREGENPARWRGHLAMMLPARTKIAPVEHHAALPWRDLPAFMSALASREGIAPRALEFLILTAARSGEVRGMRWGEVDLARAIWTMPGPRMKAGREHRVPLSAGALAVLRAFRIDEPTPDHLVFSSPMRSKPTPLSDMTLTAVLRRMGRGDLTAHGFRSAFRDWAAEATEYPGEVAEAALAHTVGDKVEAAYRRGDLFEKRRQLMADWAAYCCSDAGSAEAAPVSREVAAPV
jgi:integrase